MQRHQHSHTSTFLAPLYPFAASALRLQNFKDQLSLIFSAVGSPKPHEVAHIRNPEAIRFLESMQDRVKVKMVSSLNFVAVTTACVVSKACNAAVMATRFAAVVQQLL